MKKQLLALTVMLVATGYMSDVNAQTNKNKKSRYYQNSTTDPEFDVKGYHTEPDKNEVDKKPVESEYDVKTTNDERDGKYKKEKRVIEREYDDEIDISDTRLARRAERERQYAEDNAPKVERERRQRTQSYPTTYGGTRNYNANRANYDKYYDGNSSAAAPTQYQAPAPPPPPPPPAPAKRTARKEKVIKMTNQESEYQTTVVKKRYTNLDVLCDDLDLAKIQRPVFKGICTECSHDVDLIIVNKNLSSLEKNYRLKQCYMQRDKRLRETMDDDQYKKFLRIKDADEYLILTKDPELKDGIHK
jgi:hypothetical protein